jgi:chemotaxis protein CheD
MVVVGSGVEVLSTVGLGSCVAVAIDDPVARVGGLSHIFLPEPTKSIRESQPGRYVSTAIPALVDSVIAAGGERSRLRARMAGGATMFPDLIAMNSLSLGDRNSAAARELLEGMEIPLSGEDVGGHKGRTVTLHLADSRIVVRAIGSPEVVL